MRTNGWTAPPRRLNASEGHPREGGARARARVWSLRRRVWSLRSELVHTVARELLATATHGPRDLEKLFRGGHQVLALVCQLSQQLFARGRFGVVHLVLWEGNNARRM